MSAARFATISGAEPLRGVVVGAGQLGRYWAREVLEHPDTELAGWVDLDAERVRAEADALGLAAVPTSARLEEMLDADRPDFVVNVTAPAGHHPVTMAALERDIAVLSEKPLAPTMPQALEMIAAAGRAERLLMVSQNRRYMPELVAFRDTLARLGRLSGLTCEFYVPHRNKAAGFLFAFPQPLLLDMAIHLFDGARAITGASPLSVYCDSYNPPWSWYAGPAAANAIFQMTDELRFAFTGNWAADGFRTSWTGAWRAVGELGTATWDGGSAPCVEPRPGARITAAVPIAVPRDEDRFLGLEGALADFVAALRTGSVPAGECHDNVQSLAMCHAAVESAELGAPVPVATFTSGAVSARR
ncbi:MAG: Gfo/Idh/MocA family protein [Solirubrobacteraceae bacterium]